MWSDVPVPNGGFESMLPARDPQVASLLAGDCPLTGRMKAFLTRSTPPLWCGYSAEEPLLRLQRCREQCTSELEQVWCSPGIHIPMTSLTQIHPPWRATCC